MPTTEFNQLNAKYEGCRDRHIYNLITPLLEIPIKFNVLQMMIILVIFELHLLFSVI